jgi:hypothetical protein
MENVQKSGELNNLKIEFDIYNFFHLKELALILYHKLNELIVFIIILSKNELNLYYNLLLKQFK